MWEPRAGPSGFIGFDKPENKRTDEQKNISMGWVDTWVVSGWVGSRFFSFWSVGFGCVHYSKNTKKFDRIILMHLKHG